MATPSLNDCPPFTNRSPTLRTFQCLRENLCPGEYSRKRCSEQELQSHLVSTRAVMMEILSVNRVVKNKVEQECERVLTLSAACLTDGATKTAAMDELSAERAVLKTKTMALSDLLAVFRAT